MERVRAGTGEDEMLIQKFASLPPAPPGTWCNLELVPDTWYAAARSILVTIPTEPSTTAQQLNKTQSSVAKKL